MTESKNMFSRAKNQN